VQEVFLAAAQAARQFDSERGGLWSWLAGIAHHKVVAHWRQEARADRVRALAQAGAIEIRHWLDGQSQNEPNLAEDAAPFQLRVSRAGPIGGASADGSPDAAGLAATARAGRDQMDGDLADVVRGVLAELSVDYAALLTAKYLDDRTLVDLAREWGLTVEATKSKLARARREFRAKFEFLINQPTPSASR
jgi:RNA polymerase sigma-70 factor (ECF subfamily)